MMQAATFFLLYAILLVIYMIKISFVDFVVTTNKNKKKLFVIFSDDDFLLLILMRTNFEIFFFHIFFVDQFVCE